MPATSQPTDQPAGQLITDEKALERLFRSHYAKLLVDAKGRLGDASSAAPRVVSKAFHLAWIDKKRFHSMEELEAFLGANIQHGAARELSRIAGLHRMDAHGAGRKEAKHEVAEMSVDEAWDRLQHTLQGGAPEAYRARASTARHEAAEHVAQLGKERNWKPFAIIGVVAVVIAGGVMWWIGKVGESRAIDRALAAPDVRGYETGSGQQANVTLDDSTVVRLGPESKLTVPKRFGMNGGYRAVKIEGAANFDVHKTFAEPFQVRSSGAIITARGTSFVVRRYKEDSSLIVHVREGTVDLTVGDKTRSVTKGMSYAVTNAGEISVPGTDQLEEANSWADGNVTITGRTLRYVLPQLKRWYGLDIHVEDTGLLDRKVFVRAALNSPKEAITSVEQSGGLKFAYIGDNMAFQDTVPGKAKGATKQGTKATKATKQSTKQSTKTKRR
jgi:ferric-dicitrate binding protein FerR (iron transport regulator)